MRKNLPLTLALMALPTLGMGQSYENLTQADVLTGWRADAGTHMAAIKITLEPGWVTYWRAPGDGGIPPQFAFAGSSAIMSITPLWPTPEVFGENGVRSIGYYDSVVVPLVVRLDDNQTEDVDLSGEMLIGVCEEICIPVTLDFSALLPAIGASDDEIHTALSNRPVTQTDTSVTCAIDPTADGLRMTTTIDLASTGASEHVVIETADPSVWVSEAASTRIGDTLTATVDLVHPSGQAFALDRSGVRVTVLGSDKAVDLRGCIAG